MPAMVMEHAVDPKTSIYDKIGSLQDVEILNNQVLCAVYQRPERTKSGIILADATRDEDRSQGKVGLIIKTGPSAFRDDTGKWFSGIDHPLDVDDWVFYRASDGWAVTINGVLCRVLDDTNVRGRIQHPDQVW